MLIQRQLPKLYARGSIFTVTGHDLTEDERKLSVDVANQVIPHLREHRSKFIYKLSHTIGADYKDTTDGGPADLDFFFAVWKASIYLLYHCDYTFECRRCKATSYINNSGKRSRIDQRKPFCPSCECCQVADPGGSTLKEEAFIKKEALLILIDELAIEGLEPPKTRSSIKAIPGAKKHNNPNEVLDNPEQRNKFFSEFIWNYFRQVIKENKIQKEFKEKSISGCSDIVAVECVLAYLRKNEIKHSYNPADDLQDGFWFIKCDLLSLAPRFTPELAAVIHQSMSWGVEVNCDRRGVWVKDQKIDHTIVSTNIKTREYVIMETSMNVRDGEKQQDKIESLEGTMSNVAEFDLRESMAVVREALSDDAKSVFDIFSQSGSAYDEFEREYGSGKPRKADIARFLGASTKHVNEKMSEIRIHWTRMVPFTDML